MLGTAPLSNSWIIIIIRLYIALNRTPNTDCYWGRAVPNGYGSQDVLARSAHGVTTGMLSKISWLQSTAQTTQRAVRSMLPPSATHVSVQHGCVPTEP